MIDIVILIVGGLVAAKAYAIGLIPGLVVSLLVLGVLLYRRFTSLCMAVAMRCYTKGKKNKAMDWFERGYNHGMKTNEKLTYTYYLLREGRIGKCEEILNSMLAFRSAKPQERYQAKSNHALLLMKTGRLYEAVEEMEEIFPNYKNTSMYASLGYCYLVQGNYQKALEFNEEAYEYNGDDNIILDNLMQTYAKLGQFDKAYEMSQKLMEKDPGFREAYYDTAVIEYQLGKTDEALARLEHALTIPVSFLTTVSDEIIQSLRDRIAGGTAPSGSDMVFLEVKSASLPDAPTLRVRPQEIPKRRSEDEVFESDDPISFGGTKQTEQMTEETAQTEESVMEEQETSAEEEDEEDDGVFL